MIVVKNLNKNFGKITAVNGLNLNVKKKTTYGLIGPNGAGKTTTIDILSTLAVPSSGSVEINGFDLAKEGDKVRESIGLMPQDAVFHQNNTVLGTISFLAELKGENKNSAVKILKEVGLGEKLGAKIRDLSHGMKKKLMIAQAVLGKPEVLILDEPLTGLDPKSRIEIRKLIGKFAKGCTVFISSHHLEEIEKLCDYVGVLKEGKLVVEDKLSKLSGNKNVITFKILNINDKMLESLKIKHVKNLVRENKLVTIHMAKDVTDDILKVLVKQKANIETMKKGKSIEEIFLESIE